MTERTRDYLSALAGMTALCVLIYCVAVGLPIAHEVFTVPR